VVGRRVAHDGPHHPGVGGEDKVSQGLNEGPLAADALVQQLLGERPGALNGRVPPALDNLPCPPEPVGVGGSHEHAVGIATVEFGLDQRANVDPVDRYIVDVAVDLHPLEPGAADHGVLEIDVVEARLAEVDLLEAAVAQVRAQVVRHRRHFATAR